MPFKYVGEETGTAAEGLEYYLQARAIEDFSGSVAELKFKNATETNAILLKKGIDYQTIRQFAPKELATLLGVEYIIMGSVLQNMTGVLTQTHRNGSAKQTSYRKYEDVKARERYLSHSSPNTRQNFETDVSISIFNESGEQMYTRSRHSILTDKDAYKNALRYLIKRTPLFW